MVIPTNKQTRSIKLTISRSKRAFKVNRHKINKDNISANLVLRKNLRVNNKKKNKTAKKRAIGTKFKGGNNNTIKTSAINDKTEGNILKGIFRASFFINLNNVLQEIYF